MANKYTHLPTETDRIKMTLREAGFRATEARIAVLILLTESEHPLGVKELQRLLKVTLESTDQATVYRILNSYVKAGLVLPVELRRGYTCYELAAQKHHHHIICEKCGLISDVACDISSVEKNALKESNFSEIRQHSLEFFGRCNDCINT